MVRLFTKHNNSVQLFPLKLMKCKPSTEHWMGDVHRIANVCAVWMMGSKLMRKGEAENFLRLWIIFHSSVQFSSIWFSHSVVSDSLQPHELPHARSLCPSPTPKVYSNSCPSPWLVMSSNHLIFCHPLLLPPISPSIRIFFNESTLHMRWPKYWSFSFSISPSIEHPGLISFRMDWLDLLAFQGTLKSLLQHHSSKASIFQCSAFFTVRISHPYMTTGKTIALTRWTFVGKVMSLLLNMLSKLVITFLAKSKHLLIS